MSASWVQVGRLKSQSLRVTDRPERLQTADKNTFGIHMASGYSGTPLVKKLGIKDGFKVATVDEPSEFRGFLIDLPDAVDFEVGVAGEPNIVMLFVTERAVLEDVIPKAAEAIFPAGAIWVAWPKKASKVPTDVTEDTVREVALPMGLVDNKVYAISEIWSGLRVVWRKELRK